MVAARKNPSSYRKRSPHSKKISTAQKQAFLTSNNILKALKLGALTATIGSATFFSYKLHKLLKLYNAMDEPTKSYFIHNIVKAKEDPFKILGLNKNATDAEIKKTGIALWLKYHPDKNKSPDAEEIFKKINPAYQCLKNPNCLQLVKLIRRSTE
jgi:hypothetical protein